MENQSCFDLERALLAWKQDCARHPGISMDDARELESHLRDCIGELRTRGRTEEEAFRAALRQVGSTSEVAHEFARENPMAVWRDRAFWVATAALSFSVWINICSSAVSWALKDFGPLLPFPYWPVWSALIGYLPVLLIGGLLVTGRMRRLREWLRWCMQSRERFACVGGLGMISAVVALVSCQPQGSWGSNALLCLDLLIWPTLFLSIGTILLRPLLSARWAGSAADPTVAPAAVWRDRVFWMAAAGLLVGFWFKLAYFASTALFYTGDANHPYDLRPLVLTGIQLLILLGPVATAACLLVWHVRRGGRLPSDLAPGRQSMCALVPALLCVLVVLTLWTSYLWQPRNLYSQFTQAASWRWGRVLMDYASTLQWLWPAGLGVLAVWLAPSRRTTKNDSEPVTT